MTGKNHKKGRFAVRTALVCVGAVVVLGLAAAPAGAQSICQQYPNAPECDGDVGPGGGNGGNDNLPFLNGGSNPSGDFGDGNGKLPFTGYPLTPLILLFLILLAAGLATRTYVAVRGRLAARGDSGSAAAH
jgi:hypothetical protein